MYCILGNLCPSHDTPYALVDTLLLADCAVWMSHILIDKTAAPRTLNPEPKNPNPQTSRGGADGHQRRPVTDREAVRRETPYTGCTGFEAQNPLAEPACIVVRLRSANHRND